MFVVDINNGEIYEYALTTAFNLSTASYANSSFSSTQVYVPSGVAFNPDGTKMFVAGFYNSKIYEYALGTSFDLSTASYANSSFSVGTQGTGPTGVAFNPAGTKMFVTNSANTSIYEYKLATPVDLSKLFISELASTNDISLTGASIETVGNSTSIEIKLTAPQLQSALELTTPELDIMQAAVSDVSGNEIAAAPDNAIAVTNSVAAVPPPLAAPTDLSWAVQGTTATITWTAPVIPANSFYDISNVSYIVNVTDTAAVTTVQYTISDGTITTYAVTGLTPGKSYEVTVEAKASLTDSTVLNSQPTAAVSFNVPAVSPVPSSQPSADLETATPARIVKEVSPVPSSQPSADNTPPTFDSATLDEKTGVLAITFDETIANEGFDLSTADYTDTLLIRSQDQYPTGMAFNPSGTKMFVTGYNNAKIYEYELSTPFDVSSSSYANRSFPVDSQDDSPEGVAFNTNGTKMFVVGVQNEKIYEYELSTPFDVSSSDYKRNFSVSDEDTYPMGVAFSTNGTLMFVAGSTTDKIYEYALTTAFDLSTASYTDRSVDVSSEDTRPTDVTFNPAGTKMFVVGTNSDNVNEYTLTTPFNLSTASFVRLLSVSSEDDLPEGVAFNPDGTKMFVVGYSGGDINEYTLTTPVDLSKLFISELGSVNGTGTALTGASIETVGNSDSIEIHLTEPQIESVIKLTVPQLDIMAAAVSDVSGNEIAAAPDNAIAVTNSVSVVTITYKSQFGGDVLTAPYGIAFEPDGDILVADSVADKIFVFYNNGTLKSSFGSDGSGDGQFDSPKGVSLAPNGDIFVADDGNDRIQVFNSTYNYKTQFGFADSDSTRNITSPVNIAFEPDGDVLVVDLDSGQVFVFDPVFSFKSKFDLGQGTAPIDVARLPNGDILVADFFKHRISVFDSAYNYKTQFGSAGLDDGQLNVPRALHVTYNGDILVIEGGNDRISVFDSAYNYKFQFGSHGSSDGEFIALTGVALAPNGDIFVADGGNARIQVLASDYYSSVSSGDILVSDGNNNRISVFDSAYNYKTQFGLFGLHDNLLNNPRGIAVASDGDILVTDWLNNRIKVYATDGSYKSQFGSGGSGDGEFNYPRSVAVESDGDILVADTFNHRIQVFDSAYNYKSQFGSYGTIGDGANSVGKFASPSDVSISSNGNIVVIDTWNNRIQVFDSNYDFLFEFGSSGEDLGNFVWPETGAVDSDGNMLVGDTGNSRIQVFDSNGNFQSSFGSGLSDSKFHVLGDLHAASNGDILVADLDNYRIQVFDSAGNYKTSFGHYGVGNGGMFSAPFGVSAYP